MATTSVVSRNRRGGGAGGVPKPAALRKALPLLDGSFLRSTPIRIGLVIVGFYVLVAIFAPVFLHGDPEAFSPDALAAPSAQHWLGTTQTGQDVFLQVVLGTRVTILVGFAVGIAATLLSVVVGISAAYFGGVADETLSVLTNVFLVIPALPLAIVLTSYLTTKGPLPLAAVITLTGWAWGARVLRAQTLSLRKRDFVEAARASGEGPLRIMFAEILPNEIAIVMSSLIFTIIYAILAEMGLEFIGLGDVTVNSWGNMLFWATNDNALLVGAWWWVVPPGFCMAVLGAGLAFINFGIDEITNPRLRTKARV
jgi:peptide/nickel transport system permease protein